MNSCTPESSASQCSQTSATCSLVRSQELPSPLPSWRILPGPSVRGHCWGSCVSVGWDTSAVGLGWAASHSTTAGSFLGTRTPLTNPEVPLGCHGGCSLSLPWRCEVGICAEQSRALPAAEKGGGTRVVLLSSREKSRVNTERNQERNVWGTRCG